MGENAFRVLVRAELRQRGNHRESDGRHGDELEETCENGGDERKQLIELRDAEAAENAADGQRRNPKHQLLALPLRAICLQDGARRFVYICIWVPISHGKSFLSYCISRSKTSHRMATL